MNKFLVALIFLFPGIALAQQVSDEALAECQPQGTSFLTLNECLPSTQVAIELLRLVPDATYYGDAGRTLVQDCGAINENSLNTWWCVQDVLSSAARLIDMVGDANRIDDPRFAGVANSEAYERLNRSSAEKMGAFGGTPRLELTRGVHYLD